MTFECATNLTGYTLSFAYGGSVDLILKETDLPGGGKSITTTFTVMYAINGTSVRCIADDNINMTTIFTLLAYVYAQG